MTRVSIYRRHKPAPSIWDPSPGMQLRFSSAMTPKPSRSGNRSIARVISSIPPPQMIVSWCSLLRENTAGAEVPAACTARLSSSHPSAIAASTS